MLSMAVCIAVLAIAAGYTVGVVSQNNVIAQIDVNIGSIETYLEKNHNATQLLTDEFKEDYSAKTRTIARTVRSSPMTGRWKNCVSQSTPI